MGTRRPPWVPKAKRLAIRHMGEGAKARGIALLLGLNADYFSAAFRRSEGEAFSHWYRRAKVRRAKRLVRKGATVLEAALAVGYADARGLQRAAKSVEGCEPRSWSST